MKRSRRQVGTTPSVLGSLLGHAVFLQEALLRLSQTAGQIVDLLKVDVLSTSAKRRSKRLPSSRRASSR